MPDRATRDSSTPKRRAPAGLEGKPRRRAGADDRSRQERGSARREQILEAAVELFSARGYRGTGVAALGERVGMTAPGLLYYFGSKERLLLEVVAERDRADALGAADLTLDTLRSLGRHNMETATLTRLFAVLCAESFEPDEPLHDYFVERYEIGRSLVRAILDEERRRKKLRKGVDIDQVAAEVMATIMGFEIQWLLDPSRVDLGRGVELYMDRLIRDLVIK
jgi:AcrR family transcriptional regulator